MIDSFNLFTAYCERMGTSHLVRNNAYCLFVTTYQKVLKEHEKRTGSQAKPKESQDKLDALLTEDSVMGFVSRAEEILSRMEEDIKRPYVKENGAKQFWISVASSVVASFFYSVILIIVFWVAKDQISTWLQSLQTSNG